MAADGSLTRGPIDGPVAQLRVQVNDALRAGDFEAAFGAINATVLRAVYVARRHRILSFGAAEVDELCRRVARRWLATHRPDRKAVDSPSPAADLYIASALYDGGGHTALIGDFISSMPARRAMLAVTNLADQPGELPETTLRRVSLEPSQVEVCRSTGLADKFAWLIDVIDRVRPDRIFLFNHHEDSMAIAACQASDARETVFVHHSDRVPSVGAFLPFAVHVDITPFCFHCCRQQAGLSNRYVPLVVADQGARGRSSNGFVSDQARRLLDAAAAVMPMTTSPPLPGLRTAAAGSTYKFRETYDPGYFDVIGAVLKATGGWHVHIGHLPDDDLARFRNVLTTCGVDTARLIYAPHVPSIWRAMSDHKIDLYVGSFPTRGARTSVEVMGSGTPAVWHVTRPATLFHDTHMKYDGAATWQTVEELLAIVDRIDRRWLTRQSRLARRHYERNHHPRLMARCLSGEAIVSHRAKTSGTEASGTEAPGASSSEPRLVSLDDLLSLD